MAEEEKDVFYVGIKSPVEIRRGILESSKGVIEALQRYERLKVIRNEKGESIDKLKALIKEIIRDVNKLKSDLPKAKIRIKSREEAPLIETEEEEVKPKKVKVKKKAAKKAKKEVKPKVTEEKPKPLGELEKLESELSSIEKKLSRIS
jgi:hypothetical protein